MNRWGILILLAFYVLMASASSGAIASSGSISWDGNEADCVDGPVPNGIGGNVVFDPGVKVIASGALQGNPSHQIEHIHDGLYGNSHSWIGGDDESWIGYDFGRTVTLSGFAFSRDNTSLGLTDRVLGTYRIQVAATPFNQTTTPWMDLGEVMICGTASWGTAKRHRFSVTPAILARCIRIWVPTGACIDEMECFETPNPESPARSTRRIPPQAKTALALRRGIAIDRQYHILPVPESMQVRSKDVQLIRSMGFDFIKLIVNPSVHQDGSRAINMSWVQQIVDTVVKEGMVAVLCLHPERDFKESLFGDQSKFREYLGFQEAFARYIAEHWSCREVAFELMTEPFGTSQIPSDWNHWNALQPLMWQAARRAMPDHTLILSGDQVGHIRGFIQMEPVDDPNVMYSFTTYDPVCFTHQKATWLEVWWPFLGGVPYPSNPETIQKVLPGILAGIPAEPAEWRAQARAVIEAYGEERWNKAKQDRRIQQIVEWNAFYGGGLRLWCAEFGAFEAGSSGASSRDRCLFIRDLREVFEEHGIGWCAWSYNEVFSILRNDHRQPFGDVSLEDIDCGMMEALGLPCESSSGEGGPGTP